MLILGSLVIALEALPPTPLLPEALQIPGLLLALGGGALWFWGAAALALLGRGTPLFLDPPRRLVVVGPYRWIRNPMHLGLAAFLAGEALLFRSIPLVVFAAAATALLVLGVVPREERELAERFGVRYERYREAVPAWLPSGEDLRRLRGRTRERLDRIRRGGPSAPPR